MRSETTSESDLGVLQRLLSERHSCRGFRPDPLPHDLIERWLSTSQRAASWCNTQPWRLVVTEGNATRRFVDGLAEAVAAGAQEPEIPFPPGYEGLSLARRREVGRQLYDAVSIARGDRVASARQAAENFRLFGAPHVAIVTCEKALGVYGAVDTGLYLGTLMLTAQALGIGCIAQASLARYPVFIRRHFGLAEDRTILCGLSFGYADPAHPANRFRSSRSGLEHVVTWKDE